MCSALQQTTVGMFSWEQPLGFSVLQILLIGGSATAGDFPVPLALLLRFLRRVTCLLALKTLACIELVPLWEDVFRGSNLPRTPPTLGLSISVFTRITRILSTTRLRLDMRCPQLLKW